MEIKNGTAVVAVVFVAAFATTTSMAHVVPWREGESRQLGFGHCAKGPCMKRTSWSAGRPHQHIDGKVIFDRYIRPSHRGAGEERGHR